MAFLSVTHVEEPDRAQGRYGDFRRKGEAVARYCARDDFPGIADIRTTVQRRIGVEDLAPAARPRQPDAATPMRRRREVRGNPDRGGGPGIHAAPRNEPMPEIVGH